MLQRLCFDPAHARLQLLQLASQTSPPTPSRITTRLGNSACRLLVICLLFGQETLPLFTKHLSLLRCQALRDLMLLGNGRQHGEQSSQQLRMAGVEQHAAHAAKEPLTTKRRIALKRGSHAPTSVSTPIRPSHCSAS